MSLKQNQSPLTEHPQTELKKPAAYPTIRRSDHQSRYESLVSNSPQRGPLSDKTNNNLTSHKKGHAKIDEGHSIPHVSAFEKMYVGSSEGIKNDLILNIVPNDPHLTNLVQTLERQAKEYQQKQLIESFPLRYNDLLNKEMELSALSIKHNKLTQYSADMQQQIEVLKASLIEKDNQQIEKENKLRLVMEQNEIEKERLLQDIRIDSENNITLIKKELNNQRHRTDQIEKENKVLLQQLEDIIGEKHKKQLQIKSLTEAVQSDSLNHSIEISQLNKTISSCRQLYQQQTITLKHTQAKWDRLHEDHITICREYEQSKKHIQSLSLEKGALVERINRIQQQRQEFKVQCEQLKLDNNQFKTIIEQKAQQIIRLNNLQRQINEKLENNSFVIAQLQGDITLKQVDLGDKTADLINLRESMLEMEVHLNKLAQENRMLTRQKTQLVSGMQQSQQKLKIKFMAQQDTVKRLQEEVEFTKKANGHLLAIREELEAENIELKSKNNEFSEQFTRGASEKKLLQDGLSDLKSMLDETIASNHQQYESLKSDINDYIQQEEDNKKQAELSHSKALSKITLLEEECKRLQASVDRHIKALASKQYEHDKIVTKLIEASKSQTLLIDKQNEGLLEEANNRINSLTNQIGEKDEQIKSLQGLLRETRTTILGLSDSLKERTIREKELFDEVLSEKKRMKKQIELLEIELKPGRRL